MSSSPTTTRMVLRRWSLKAGALCAIGVISYPAWANDVNDLAARLAELRGEVEQLAQSLNEKSADTKAMVHSLARQRADLELELQREETRVQKLSAAVAKHRAETAAEQAKGQRMLPLYQESLAKTEAYVRSSLPFRRSERLDALRKIDEQHKAGMLSPPRALSRLWSFIEDEFRMTRESGLFQQTVVVDGQERLAEVARLGMVMLFYRTNDGDIGKAVEHDGAWTFEALSDPEAQRAVHELFTSFKKQIRVGYFEIPNALPNTQSEELEQP